MCYCACSCNQMRTRGRAYCALSRTIVQIGRQNVGILAHVKKLLYLCIGFTNTFFMVLFGLECLRRDARVFLF